MCLSFPFQSVIYFEVVHHEHSGRGRSFDKEGIFCRPRNVRSIILADGRVWGEGGRFELEQKKTGKAVR